MSDTPMQEFWVARDVDRLGEYLSNSTSDFFFKVSTEDSHGGLLVVEMMHHVKFFQSPGAGRQQTHE